jgi:hypothetical protein
VSPNNLSDVVLQPFGGNNELHRVPVYRRGHGELAFDDSWLVCPVPWPHLLALKPTCSKAI